MTQLKNLKVSGLLAQTLEQAFPAVDSGHVPLGSLILVQVRKAAGKTKGGILLPDHDQATERDNTQIAKVIACGPLAFHTRDTGTPWPEGAWVKVGDYVRIPKYQVNTFSVPLPGTCGVGAEESVNFVLLDDLVLQAIIKDPLAHRAFF